MPAKKEEKRHLGHENFFQDMFGNNIITMRHNDEKANWILAISGGIMALIFPHIQGAVNNNNFGLIIIFSSALISFLISLLIFDPPKFLKLSSHNPKDFTYYKSIYKKYNAEEYATILKSIKTNDQIIEQYAYAIADMTLGNIIVKTTMIRWPTYILFFGILVGSLIMLF